MPVGQTPGDVSGHMSVAAEEDLGAGSRVLEVGEEIGRVISSVMDTCLQGVDGLWEVAVQFLKVAFVDEALSLAMTERLTRSQEPLPCG